MSYADVLLNVLMKSYHSPLPFSSTINNIDCSTLRAVNKQH